MPGPVVSIRCSQCQRFYAIRQRDIKRIKGVPLCGECRGVGENNANWLGGISLNRTRYNAIQRERYPERCRARRIAERALRRGELVPQPCETHGDQWEEMHHDDYDYPLRVRWFCKMGHLQFHAEQKAREKMTQYVESPFRTAEAIARRLSADWGLWNIENCVWVGGIGDVTQVVEHETRQVKLLYRDASGGWWIQRQCGGSWIVDVDGTFRLVHPGRNEATVSSGNEYASNADAMRHPDW